MLIFGLVFLSHVKAAPGPAVAFVVLWILAVIAGIIYHLVNATRTGGVPTNIIESESGSDVSTSAAARLQELEDLRGRELISETEYQTKRQNVLNEL